MLMPSRRAAREERHPLRAAARPASTTQAADGARQPGGAERQLHVRHRPMTGPAMLLALQRTVGNRAVARQLTTVAAPPIQRVDWEDKIDYQPGDKIYGGSPVYGKAAKAVQKAYKKRTGGESPSRATVQSFIDRLLPDEDGGTYADLQENAKSLEDEAFFAWFQTSKYWGKIGGKVPTKHDLKKMKQICKAGILFVAQEQGKRIHFILAGLLNDEAMRGITGAPGKKPNNVSVRADGKMDATTSKELRSVYRNWDDLKDQVLFYDDDGAIIPAPWEAGPFKAFWDSY